jgi:DNA-directed RNA polymerase specialized sigma54-like protein
MLQSNIKKRYQALLSDTNITDLLKQRGIRMPPCTVMKYSK